MRKYIYHPQNSCSWAHRCHKNFFLIKIAKMFCFHWVSSFYASFVSFGHNWDSGLVRGEDSWIIDTTRDATWLQHNVMTTKYTLKWQSTVRTLLVFFRKKSVEFEQVVIRPLLYTVTVITTHIRKKKQLQSLHEILVWSNKMKRESMKHIRENAWSIYIQYCIHVKRMRFFTPYYCPLQRQQKLYIQNIK